MSLTPGATLGPYSVTAKIGEGGMGQVWQATDTQLNRQVALKILPGAFADDAERLARFQREAQVLASLNHPNIASIYGIEQGEPSAPDGEGSGQAVRALVLELVEGPTLADRIAKGPIPVEDALPLATQIAEALEAAHEQGVIHRDLKPANIKVREDGTVKVLDFGLAKAFQPDVADPNMSLSPTISLTAAATQMGMIVGTAAYMAPEQAKGKPVDKRADIWAFGAVLYEMLTGRKPFLGDDVSDTLALVLKFEPEWDALPDEVPARVRQLIQICLQKDPKQRFHDVADVRLAMAGAFETTIQSASPSDVSGAAIPARPSHLVTAAVAVAVALVTGLAVWGVTRSPSPTEPPVTRFAITPPPGTTVTSNVTVPLDISPQGTRVVFAAGSGAVSLDDSRLYLRQTAQLESVPIRGTERASSPFFSPDGEWVGFHDASDGTLKRVSVLGGPTITICRVEGLLRGASWGPDDTIVFASNESDGLLRVPSRGGEPEVLTTVDPAQARRHAFPEVLPNGAGVLFAVVDVSSGSRESQVAVASLATGEVTYLLPGVNPRYAATGHIVYGVQGTLLAVGFDAERLELSDATPVALVEDVAMRDERGGGAQFALADNGTLVYVSGGPSGGGGERSLVWVDRDGREEPLPNIPPAPYVRPRLSPDGTRLAVDVQPSDGNADVWVHDLTRGTRGTLTTNAARDSGPLWTPDGTRLVFHSTRDNDSYLYSKSADGTGDAERLMAASEGRTSVIPAGWSEDGQTLVFWEIEGGASPGNIGRVSLGAAESAELIIATEFRESAPSMAPGGDWIAYFSNESGTDEVYVQRFPELGDKVTISTAGGREPVWSRDGTELFYRGPEGMMVVPVETEPTFRVGVPELLFDRQYFFYLISRTYDVHPDGQRFLMVKATDPSDSPAASDAEIVAVANWFQELTERVPVD